MYDSSNQQNFTNSSTIYVNSGIEFPLVPANVGSNWTSSNTNVATVDDDGIITTLSPGTTTITASVSTIATYSMTVEVLIPNGIYYIKHTTNNEYIQAKKTSNNHENYYHSGMSIGLDAFSGAAYQRWSFVHLGNGWYTITTPADGYILYLNYSEEENRIQQLANNTTSNSQWKIVSNSISDGSFHIINKAVYESTGSIDNAFLGYNSGNVSIVSNTNSVPWILQKLDDTIVTLCGIPSDGTPLIPDLKTVGENLNSSPQNINNINIYENAMSASTCLDLITNSDIFTIRCHGNYENCDSTYLILDHSNETRLYSHYTTEIDGYSSYISSSNDFSGVKIAVFLGCFTGYGENNIAKRVYQQGASISIGFKDEINRAASGEWIIKFYNELIDGETINNAVSSASGLFEPQNQELYKLRVEDIVIFGDSTATLSSLGVN